MTVQTLRNSLEQQKGQKIATSKSLETLQKELKEKTESLHKHEEAKEIIRKVGLDTQSELEVSISDITSLALEAVFGELAYALKVEFLQRRNKTECDIYFERDGNRIDPLTASGVGAVDVAAFALRIASWSMQTPHSRNVIILDEPFRFLSENYQEKASEMLHEISQRLDIQLILVTHEMTLTTAADKIFEVGIRKGVSYIN